MDPAWHKPFSTKETQDHEGFWGWLDSSFYWDNAQSWSARVTLKIDYQLIRSGPYAWVRHPLYSGLLLAMAGTALVVGEWRGVIGVVVALVEFSRKAAKEEALLAGEFGERYQEYRKQASFSDAALPVIASSSQLRRAMTARPPQHPQKKNGRADPLPYSM